MTLLLLRDDDLARKRDRDPSARRAPETADHTRLVCRHCGTTIATADAVMPRGDWPLVFANPHGLVFELVLLRAAQQLILVGPATTEHTWFSGYAWRVALCGGCGVHLGWRFEAVEPERSPALFFGLQSKELVEADN
jgi:cereblon